MPNAIMPNAKCQFHQFAELMELALWHLAFGVNEVEWHLLNSSSLQS